MLGTLLSILLLLASAPLTSAQVNETPPRPVNRLVPGEGWRQETVAQSYPGTYEEAVCIAHWTRVPDQILWRTNEDPFRLGVLAYHRSRVQRVRMAVDAGPWIDVTELSRSAQTDHYEYGALMRAEDFARGWHEVRAVVIPESGPELGGTERVLVWRFYASLGEENGVDFELRWVDPVSGSDTSGDGTNANPFFSLRHAIDSVASNPEGARILLRGDGSTPIPIGGQTTVIDNERPITIRRAPGQFPILGPQSGGSVDRMQVRNLRLEELRIDYSFDDLLDRGSLASEGRFVLANCDVQGFTEPAGQGVSLNTFFPNGADERIWMAGGRATDFDGLLEFEWARGIEVSDAETVVTVQALINSQIRNTTVGFEGNLVIRADENALVDGVAVLGGATAAGPLEGGATDGTAIVNSLFDGTQGAQFYETVGAFSPPRRHMLLLQCSFPGAHVQVNSATSFPGPFDQEHGLVFGVVTEFITDEGSGGFLNNAPGSPSGLDLDPNSIHTHHPGASWSAWSAGSPSSTYFDLASQDFRIRTGSPAATALQLDEAYNPFDLNARPRGRRTALGALKGVGE